MGQTEESIRSQVDKMTGGRNERRMTTGERMASLLTGRLLTRDLRLVMGRA